jgi:hypothetical protein
LGREERISIAEMLSTCIKCNKSFEPEKNRAFDARKQDMSRGWPLTYSNFMKEFEKYQMVECPFCGTLYQEPRLKVFLFFSPKQIIGVIVIINILFISFALFWLLRYIINVI